MKRLRIGFTSLLSMLLLAIMATPTQGQDSHSIRIADGAVYIDGRQVPDDELPEGLDAEGIELQYVFSGDVAPVIRIGRDYFVLDGGELREATPQERSDVAVIFRNRPEVARLRDAQAMERMTAAMAAENAALAHALEEASAAVAANSNHVMSVSPAPHIAIMQMKAEELQERAKKLQELQNLGASLDPERIEALERAARELTLQAEETARAARAMPQMQVQGYLSTIREHNEALFDKLIDERSMEHETYKLASEIRQERNEDLRAQMTDRLRTRLHEIFDLKQDNRRREINELEQRLDELQDNLAERERRRDDIVERRLRQLLGEDGPDNW